MNPKTRLKDYMLREKEEPEKTKQAALDYLKTLPLTNKEWLATIPNEEATEVIMWLINTYALTTGSAKQGITEWLGGKHDSYNNNTDNLHNTDNPGSDWRWQW